MNNIELIDFVREKNTRIVAMKMLSGTIINPEMASDFDVFNIFCEKLYLLAANTLRERFLRAICEASGCEIKPIMLYDCEYRKKLWQKMFLSEDIVLPQCVDKPSSVVGTTKRSREFCLNSAIDISFESIHALLENTIEKIKSEGAGECFFDATEITYIRPDDFHAQKAYDEIKSGAADRSLISLWLLCRVLMNTSLSLRLRVDSQKKAEDILSLVYRLGLLPRVIISYDASTMMDYSDMYQYLIDNHKKNISLELDFSKENSEYILRLLSEIPLAFVEKINLPFEIIQGVLSGRIEQEEIPLVNFHLSTVK